MSIWISTLLLSVLAAAIDFGAEPGINWPLWTIPAAVALYYFTRRANPAAAREIVVPLALALIISAGAAVTSSDPLHFFIVIASVLLFSYASRIAAGEPVAHAGAGFLAASPLIGAVETAKETWDRVAHLADSAKAGRTVPALRGTLIALPVVIVLWALLAAADPHLSRWGDTMRNAISTVIVIPRLMFAGGIAVLTLGALGLASRTVVPVEPATSRRAGRTSATERLIVLGAIATLFGAFFVLQLPAMFGNPAAAAGTGVTYASWVHRGFAELTTAASIVTVLIVALDVVALRGSAGQERAARALSFTLLALTAFVVLSAFRRIALYEAAYGYTVLRLWAQTFMVCVWVALALTALEIARGLDPRRLARRGAVVGALALATLIYWNTGAFIVRENVARFIDSGKVDVVYLAGDLSMDALPSVLAARGSLPPAIAGRLTELLEARITARCTLRPGAWYEYNVRRWEAIRMAAAQQWPTCVARSD